MVQGCTAGISETGLVTEVAALTSQSLLQTIGSDVISWV